MARLFGAGAIYDAFLLGFRIPNLTRDLFAEGALSSAFVPIFTQYLATKGKRAAAELSNLVATALIVVVGTLCIAGIVFSPQLVRLMAPGFEQVPGKFELAVLLTRIMFPFLVLVALAAQAMGVLNACGRFGMPAMASTFFNLGSVRRASRWDLPSAARSPRDRSYAWRAVWWPAARCNFCGRYPECGALGSTFGRDGIRATPACAISCADAAGHDGNAAVQINVMVNTNFASSIRDASGQVISGPVSWLGYAFRFMQLPLGLFGAAIASATLPAISRSAAFQRMDEFRSTLAQSLGAHPAADTAFVGGAGDPRRKHDRGGLPMWPLPRFRYTSDRDRALPGTAPGSPDIRLSKFWLRLSTRCTMRVRPCGERGIGRHQLRGRIHPRNEAGDGARWPGPLHFRGGSSGRCHSLALLRARTGGLHTRELAASAAKFAAASAIMGTACYVSSHLIHRAAGAGKPAQLMDVAVSIPLGALVFYGAARFLRIPEVEAVRTACYTALRNAPRPEVGDPPARNR